MFKRDRWFNAGKFKSGWNGWTMLASKAKAQTLKVPCCKNDRCEKQLGREDSTFGYEQN